MITGLYAGILGIALIVLILRIVFKRRRYLVGIGDGGIEDLAKSIRVHGNFVETVPIILVLMLVMELGALNPLILHVYGILLVIARFFHVIGLSAGTGVSTGRFLGISLSLGLIFFGSVCSILLFLR